MEPKTNLRHKIVAFTLWGLGSLLLVCIVLQYFMYTHIKTWDSIPPEAYPAFLAIFRAVFFGVVPVFSCFCIGLGVLIWPRQ